MKPRVPYLVWAGELVAPRPAVVYGDAQAVLVKFIAAIKELGAAA